ncbi:MAG TPA: NAD-dependent epimerase/dehydratase family protein [Pseudonocardia sp.]|uniref:NAD-dependent epimerase/dehydratase family protein n=1 Tax=Pseudonocardia sp. TaxID=60912 RepID=UPI002C275658|nr:NAD-dependent epimerase/dehydratase family protein [Pseudonocardia sp.]HTF54562.1 NAD-dependent epimerase/dehydratase family protein [Pseudonocardia sp.]
MTVAIITGAAGLIGSEAALHFGGLGLDVVGIDNDMRRVFFGADGSTDWNRQRLQAQLGGAYTHLDLDIRNRDAVQDVFTRYGNDIGLVVHTAAQPSHDWAAGDPFTDFDVNAVGTLNVLQACRVSSPTAPFIFTSTNKVYGDRPNSLPLVERDTRWEIAPGHTYQDGIREDMSIDTCLHSVFGASKVAADVMVQEYGRYFDMPTACFRGGTLTGPQHSAAQLHGFLGYVMKCAMSRTPYTVFGYGGKQVRDAIHCADLINAFDRFWRAPRVAEVYNIGGSRFSNCSVIEAITLAGKITRQEMAWSYSETHRTGDHIWWIGDNGRFAEHYPGWQLEHNVEDILTEMFDANAERWST